MPQSTPVYPIAVVRKLTGLSDRQIRYYEQVGLLKPARTAGRRRLFSPLDVEALLRIKADMERGLRTPEIRAALVVQEERDTAVPTSGRQRLPHFDSGRSGLEREPDVETRRAFMAQRPSRPSRPAGQSAQGGQGGQGSRPETRSRGSQEERGPIQAGGPPSGGSRPGRGGPYERRS
ncbi:MAG: MerR family transcriptional regulator [Bacillota bacterium]|nr:MerR family transcriptional regulator [Bacillota bacterium]